MSTILSKSSILKKTIEVGSSTLLSRILGIVREGLMARYLGAGTVADVFLTAFRLPNSLRKIFAEGALSAAFVPTLVQVVRQEGINKANKLMSIAFLFFESLVLILCALAMWKAEATISFLAPGFSPEKIALTVPLLRILMPFIFFISSSALLAGSLQSVGHFFVPAFSPVLLNIFFITGLLVCWSYNVDVTYLCFFILAGGLVQCIGHFLAYFKEGFAFGRIDKDVLYQFGSVLTKFLIGSISMSIAEINFVVDEQFASFLPEGSISVLYYANRFMNVPLGVFAIAFSTILLPHFARITAYAPKRLSFYLLETTKFVLWVTLPVTIMMIFFSEKFFQTIFLSDKFDINHVVLSGHVLIAYVIGLFFFSINKILLNMYYALHVTWIPALIAGASAAINIAFNVVLVSHFQVVGLALATTISGIAQAVFMIIVLRWRFNFTYYIKQFIQFLWRFCIQIAVVYSLAFMMYYGIEYIIAVTTTSILRHFLLDGLGFWLWVCPLSGLTFLVLFYTRKLFNVNLYFLD